MKMKIDLQMFADKVSVPGKNVILLLRVKGDKTAAELLSMETEHSVNISQDATSTATKDGSIRTPGTPEAEISAASVLTEGDTMIAKLKAAMKSNSLIELWSVNLSEKVGTSGNKYKGTYYQGYLTALDFTAPAEGQVDVSYTVGVNGIGVDGDCTVSKETVEEALYAFKDTVAIS